MKDIQLESVSVYHSAINNGTSKISQWEPTSLKFQSSKLEMTVAPWIF